MRPLRRGQAACGDGGAVALVTVDQMVPRANRRADRRRPDSSTTRGCSTAATVRQPGAADREPYPPRSRRASDAVDRQAPAELERFRKHLGSLFQISGTATAWLPPTGRRKERSALASAWRRSRRPRLRGRHPASGMLITRHRCCVVRPGGEHSVPEPADWNDDVASRWQVG